jgi:hypothetical protein
VVADLIVSVVVDVLGHVAVEVLKILGVFWISTSPWEFAILDSSKFVILLPKVGLDDFGCGREPEQGGVAHGDRATTLLFILPLAEQR